MISPFKEDMILVVDIYKAAKNSFMKNSEIILNT